MSAVLGDFVITKPEIDGLMSERLFVNAPPAGTTRLSEWARAHAGTLGKHYASEMARRTDRVHAYVEGRS